MRTIPYLLPLSLVISPGLLAAENSAFEASSAAIHEVVSGKTCIGEDRLIFGEITPGKSGRYERVGRSSGTYRIGYGTILILRGRTLHSHVATVSVEEHMLYFSAEKYRCEP